MISVEAEQKILELAKLLPEKKIQIKQIAVIVDVDRVTVATIIRRGEIRSRKNKISHQKKKPHPENQVPKPSGKPERCPKCRRLVQQPCLACWLESRGRAQNAGNSLVDG